MQDLQSVDKGVDFSHKPFHEDDFTKTDAHVAQFCRETLQFVKVVQLHGGAEIEQHVRKIGALGAEFLEYSGRNQLDWKFNVAK